MKLITWNVNGIRALEKKGELENFIQKYNPDIFFIQETKAKNGQLEHIIEKYDDYVQFYSDAEKAGYAGTGIWVKKPVQDDLSFYYDLPEYDDKEGRVCRIDFEDNAFLGVYFPNGGKSKEAWEDKLVFYDRFLSYVNKLRKEGKNVIFTGDINCAHNEIDLARPQDNDGKVGFHPKERAWVDNVESNDWIDVFRHLYPDKVVYSWWSLRTRARERDVGWRLDYFFTDKKLLEKVKNIEYLSEQMGSDHCPLLMEI
ncbi:MAG: exodeoxyribonuclease III [Minisyncoccales bacterium]